MREIKTTAPESGGMTEFVSGDVTRFARAVGPQPDSILDEMRAYGEEIDFPIIGPEIGGWLQLLAQLVDARRIFEFGSGFGYSAYWFARALPSDGEIVLTEVDADELDRAREYLDRGDLGGHAVFEHGDALETVAEYEGPFDVVLIDILKHEYEAAFEAVREKVAPGGIIVADNIMRATDIEFDAVVQSVEEDAATVETNKQTRGIVDYLARVRADSQFETGILPLGNGVAVSCRTERETNSSG
jgi:caffeoyl-CoA O-methyltransferase